MAATLDIVIVNWNSGGLLRECLLSIAAADRAGIMLERVVVVDNASSDGSENVPEVAGLPVQVIRNSENRGFAAACNQGATESRADYLLFLNPDTRLFADSLAATIAFLEKDGAGDVGICGIQLVDEEGKVSRSCARFPTLRTFVYRALGLDKLYPGRFHGHLMLDWDHRQSREVDQVIGAFFLVRSALFARLGGFDERFFVYFEEADFSLRAARLGWKSYYLTAARAYHKGGGSSEQAKAKRLLYSLTSRILYGFKHFSGLDAVLLLLFAVTIEPVSLILWYFIKRSVRDVRESSIGYGLFYLSLPRLFRALWEHRG